MLSAGEYIYREGDVVMALHICQKGKVAIVQQDGIIQNMVTDGSHFSMNSLLSPGPSPSSAVTLSNCDIMYLDRDLVSATMRLCSVSSEAVRKNFATLCVPPNIHIWLRAALLPSTSPFQRVDRHDRIQSPYANVHNIEGPDMHGVGWFPT